MAISYALVTSKDCSSYYIFFLACCFYICLYLLKFFFFFFKCGILVVTNFITWSFGYRMRGTKVFATSKYAFWDIDLRLVIKK